MVIMQNMFYIPTASLQLKTKQLTCWNRWV